MNPISFLNFIDKYNKHQFDIPINEQMAFLSSLGIPKDDIERSYKQFQCQQFFSPWSVRMLWFFIAFFATPILILVFWAKGLRAKYEYKVDTIAENKGMNEVIPVELSQKYSISNKEWNAGKGLSTYDLRYIFSIARGLRQPYFVLKSIMQIASYSPRITRYTPDRIIVHQEFSFCSSLLTDYCHHRGVKHIDVMHGEKMLYIRDAFFHFDECYVWDMHYANMFISLKAEPTQFHVAVPPSLCIDVDANINTSAYADYKYYLAADNEEQIKSIVSSMQFAKREGKTVKYRIHPRYTDLNVLKKYVIDEEIEKPKEVNILESISNVGCAVGSYTTVLLQVYMSGKKVLMDDVTYKERYEQLKEYDYILANKGLETLSTMQ